MRSVQCFVLNPGAVHLLRLTLTPDLGPMRISRLLSHFGSAGAVLGASAAEIGRVKGLGGALCGKIVEGLRRSEALAAEEMELADRLGVRIVSMEDAEYPGLLARISDAPPVLYVRGVLRPDGEDRYSVAIVGSRSCTAYGIEQAERFASVLGQAGLTIVSGGARGIDTAAHRGALRMHGRTIAVLGCGLSRCYPPENETLFEEIVGGGEGGRGAVVSELPLKTPPTADNFPARNRIISGLSLGVLVVEAGERSGALITARLAAEDHNREVMALPGRVDSAASKGSLELLKSGGAALVTDPGDVISLLETAARHHHAGTHEHRYAVGGLHAEEGAEEKSAGASETMIEEKMSAARAAILKSLAEPRTLDDLARETGMEPSMLRSEITLLEIERRVMREGSRLRKTR